PNRILYDYCKTVLPALQFVEFDHPMTIILSLKGADDVLLEGIILTGCRQITSRSTTAAIYHIITGKKSVQTMQDIYIYDLQSYYGIHPTLSKDTFQQRIEHLQQQHFLVLDEQDCFQLTEQGQKWL